MSPNPVEKSALDSEAQIVSEERREVFIKQLEWIIAIILSAAVLFCLVLRTLNAGALWRDECDSLQLARMPRFGDVLEYLHFTAFPILFPTVVRVYTTLFGTSDIALRCFGLAVGILFLGVAWFQARSSSRAVPLLVPALIGLNANFLSAGLWLRGYGLGCVLLLLAFALTARFLREPDTAKLVAVFFGYLASVQCLYFNGVLVAAMVFAATSVLWMRGEWKWMWRLLAAAIICGLSYLPYVLEVFSSTIGWAVLMQRPFSWNWAVERLRSACAADGIAQWLWGGIVVLCCVSGVWRLRIIRRTNGRAERDLLLFGLLTILIGMVAQMGFLRLMQNIIMPRYYLSLISLIAGASTLIAANNAARWWLYFGRPALIVMVTALVFFSPRDELRARNSNIDTIAQRLAKEAHPSDLIVLSDAQLGISFNHYYHGTSRWMTVPQIADHRIHRYDLLQKKMVEFFPLDDVEKEIAATLKSGNRVWILGGRMGRSARVLTSAPDPQFGWQLPYYMVWWSHQLADFLQQHATRLDVIVREGKSTSRWENVQLVACEGWR